MTQNPVSGHQDKNDDRRSSFEVRNMSASVAERSLRLQGQFLFLSCQERSSLNYCRRYLEAGSKYGGRLQHTNSAWFSTMRSKALSPSRVRILSRSSVRKMQTRRSDRGRAFLSQCSTELAPSLLDNGKTPEVENTNSNEAKNSDSDDASGLSTSNGDGSSRSEVATRPGHDTLVIFLFLRWFSSSFAPDLCWCSMDAISG